MAGVLPLNELRKGTTPTVLILQGELEVTAEGKVAVNVISTEKTHTWIDAEALDTQQKFDVSLTPGRHKITVRVEVSDREAPELKVELTKPENSTIQFDVIGGA